MGWAYLKTAPDQMTATLWIDLLRANGILAMVDPSDEMSFLGISPRPCRILVDDDQHARADKILRQITASPEADDGDDSSTKSP